MTENTSGLVVPDLLRLRATQDPDQTVMNIDGAETMTYAEWDQRSNALAHGLIAEGVRRGDVVALLFGGMDWVDYAVSYLGVLKAGGMAIHLNDTMPDEEVARRLRECGVRHMVRGALLTAPEHFTGRVWTVKDLDGADVSTVDSGIGPDDYSDILYSSGTTGNPKAVRVPHGNLTYGRGPEGFKQFGDPRPLIVPMQVGTTASVTTTNVALTVRATLVATPPGDVERMAELIPAYQVGSVMINPMIAARMVAARVHERHDFGSVHTLGSAAAPLAPALADRLLAMFPGARLTTSYTEVEAVPGVIVNTYDPQRPLTTGRPTPSTQVRVVDDHDRPVPAGELGNVQLRCDAPRRRYVHNHQPPQDDWTRTGDLGSLDEQGELHLFDRAEDAIRVDGELVSSIDVESVVYEDPHVREAAVFGVPDDEHGQAVALAVVLDAPARLQPLREFLADALPGRHVPTRVLMLDALPFSPNGKVRKRELRARLTG